MPYTIDWNNVSKIIDDKLKEFGVDWKLDDKEYYEGLIDELMIVLKREIGRFI